MQLLHWVFELQAMPTSMNLTCMKVAEKIMAAFFAMPMSAKTLRQLLHSVGPLMVLVPMLIENVMSKQKPHLMSSWN